MFKQYTATAYVTSLLTLCMVCILPGRVHAQLWTGSLGDPVFAERFDGNKLPNGSTTFTGVDSCPNKGGLFLLTNFIFGCGGTDSKPWLPTGGDHTRLISKNQYSNEMLVNSGNFKGTLYQTKVDGLCGNITYQFSAFVTNMMQHTTCGGPALPNLTFTVTDAGGNVLAIYATGGIPVEGSIDWQEFGTYFTTPASPTPVTLTITSAAFGCGAVFAMDDITLRPCGTDVKVKLDGEELNYIEVCDGYTNPFLLQATYNGFTNPKTVWQESLDTGQTWKDIPSATAASYTIPHFDDQVKMYRIAVAEDVNFSSPKCRVTSSPIWVGVHHQPLKQPLTFVSACLDKDLKMPFIPGGTTYQWYGPNGYTSMAVQAVIKKIQYKDTGYYQVIAISDYGCTTTDSAYVTVSPSVTLTGTTEYNVCEGDKIVFDVTGADNYTWTPATGLSSTKTGNPILYVKDSVLYEVLSTNQYGCRDSLFIYVNRYKHTIVSAGPDKYMLSGDTVNLSGSVSGTSLQYYWSPNTYLTDDHQLNSTVHPPLGDWVYTLHANSAQGCGNSSDAVTVHVYNDFYIPNAFTPNGDGRNDVFGIMPISNYKLVRFTVYSRWGSVLFTTTTPGATWDGNYNSQPQPAGAYVYYVEMKLPNGEKYSRTGQVMLIR